MLKLAQVINLVKPLLEDIDTKFILGRKRGWKATVPLAQLASAIIWFNFSGMRCFKRYAVLLLPQLLPRHRLSYSRWAWWRQRLMPLLEKLADRLCRVAYFKGCGLVDSTGLPVCGIQRERDHKCFVRHAAKSKGSLGWFYGFKLHLVTSESGQLLRFWLTSANVHDVTALKRSDMTEGLTGSLIADSGYRSKAVQENLARQGLATFVRPQKPRDKAEQAMPAQLKRFFKKRWRIETVIGQLKDQFGLRQVNRCRNMATLKTLVFGGLIAYAMSFAA